MENIISLDHSDVDKAIRGYIAAHGVSLVGKDIDIKVTSGRGLNPTNSATVTVSNKPIEEGADAVADKKSKITTDTAGPGKAKAAPETKEKDPAPTESNADTSGDEKEVAEDDLSDQPPITEESVVVDSETDEVDDTKSLFGGN